MDSVKSLISFLMALHCFLFSVTEKPFQHFLLKHIFLCYVDGNFYEKHKKIKKKIQILHMLKCSEKIKKEPSCF